MIPAVRTNRRAVGRIVLGLIGLLLAATGAAAEVVRLEVVERRPLLGGREFGETGAYEVLTGRLHFALDPGDPRNQRITDLDRAPVGADGRVTFAADLVMLTPAEPARGNGMALFDVVNRGRMRVLAGFNQATAVGRLTIPEEIGDGFLLARGFTLVWVGWEFDVPAGADLVRITVPVADQLSDLVRATAVAGVDATSLTFGDLGGYTPADPDAPGHTLTVVAHRTGEPLRVVPRAAWRLTGNTVTLDSGFEPGARYELAYRVEGAPIAGVGFAAVRDAIAWLRHDADAPARVDTALAFGSSQSGRFLRAFLYLGFNTDEAGRQVFDGVMPHISGASRIDLNRRWPTTVSVGSYAATEFPFADARLTDPVSGAVDGALENARVGDHRPKVMYTNTGVEYWGGARAAALVHTTPDGTADLELPDDTRVYFLAGTQHGPAAFPPSAGAGAALNNPTNYWWTMRALLVAMEAWVRDGTAPPPSRYPRLADGTLVEAGTMTFPDVPGLRSPVDLTGGVRVANPWIEGGAAPGAALPLLVPQVDADGNETAGILPPDVAVPMATLTGWNFRRADIGAPGELVPLLGSMVPFARTEAEREAAGDPRPSIARRYASVDEYAGRIGLWAVGLVQEGYLLAGDLAAIDAEARARWAWSVDPSR
jgi:hypothetical protein